MIYTQFAHRDKSLVKPAHGTHFEEASAYQAAHRELMEEFGDALAAEYLGKFSEQVAERLAAEIYAMALNFSRSSEDFARIELCYLTFAGLAELTEFELKQHTPQAPVDLIAEFSKDAEEKGEHYERGTFAFGAAVQNFLNGKLDSGEWRSQQAYFEVK